MYAINPTITPGMIDSFWERVKGSPGFWGDLEGRDYDKFARSLFGSRVIILFDYGLARVSPGWSESVGEVHAVFWNRRVVRSALEIRKALRDVSDRFRFQDYVATVPRTARGLHRLLHDVGFRRRGEINRFYEVTGGSQSAILYGILRSEVQDGRND